MKLTGFILLFLFIPLLGNGQVLHYDVIKGNKVIGNLDVSRSNKNGRQTIRINSHVEYRILISFEVNFSLEETFVKNVLLEGKAMNTLNGVTQKETEIRKTDNGYTLVLGGTPTNIYDEIRYSVSEVYFREPVNIDRAFSQHFGKFVYFEKTGDHQYQLDSPDGENEYTYENGVCTEVEIYRDFGHLTFKMKPETYALVKQRADTVSTK